MSKTLAIPVLVVVREPTRLQMVKDALPGRIAGGVEKWRPVEKHGPIECCGALWVQRASLSLREAGELLASTTSHGKIPGPLRLAHIIADGVERGASRGWP